MGVSLESVFQKGIIEPDNVQILSNLFQNRKYFIVMDIKSKTIFVPIAKNAQSSEVLQAYFHASLYGLITCMTLRWPVVSE